MIFISGQNDHSQLIATSNSKNENQMSCICPPVKLEGIDWHQLRSFSIGQFHTVLISADGDILCIGDNTKSQIGSNSQTIYDHLTKISLPCYVNRKFKMALCGKNYTVYLTEETEHNREEILLCCNKNPTQNPIRINIGENKVKLIKNGKTRIGIVDSKNNLFLVEKKDIEVVHDAVEAQLIDHPLLTGIRDICICETFICVLSSNGILYGNGEINKNRKNFTQIAFPQGKKIQKIIGTHFHCVAISETFDAYVYNYNGSGQLGLGNTEDTSKFVEIPYFVQNQIKIRDAATSGFHTLFLSEDELHAYACGSNFNGQLMHDNFDEGEQNLVPSEIHVPEISGHQIQSVICSEWGSVIFVD